jgi:hypothetical protein
LTGEEWLLPLDGCELLLRREREAEYALYKAKAHEEEIKKFRLSLRIDLIMVAGGVGLWLLSRVDGLPWILEAIVVGVDNKASRGPLWISIATLGLAGGILSFFELRALRLETDRARKQANAVWATAKWLLIAAGVFFFGAILFVLGLVVRDSLNGGFERPPYIIMSFLVILLLKVPIFLWVFDWIEFRASRAGLAYLLVLFALLVAAHVFSVLDFVWLLRENAPLWSMLLLISFGTALAWPLFWVIAAAARRLREMLAARYANAEETGSSSSEQ